MIETTLTGLVPSDLELKGFKEYRQIQLEAIEQVLGGSQRFQALALPTGAGKSLVAASIQKLTGWRTVVLTSTKGLQAQYLSDFEKAGLRDIRGKNNYPCQDRRLPGELSCRDGQRVGCNLYEKTLNSACLYDQIRRKAKVGNLVCTNYAYWLNVNDKANGLEKTQAEGEPNPFECLILDEAHRASDEVANYLAVSLYEKELKEMLGVDGIDTDDVVKWKKFAAEIYVEADLQLSNMERILLTKGASATSRELEHASRLESLIGKLDTIRDTDEDWVCEYREGTKWGRSWEFDPVWPGKYAEKYLFTNIPKVVLMSATLRPKTMGLLGVKREDYEFREWSRIFPTNRNPIYYLPVKDSAGKVLRVSYRSSDEDLRLLVEQLDKIIDERLDRKILVHSVSYQRQQYLMTHSRHRGLMVGNTSEPDSDTAADVCESFKKMRAPAILVSPSFGTGWDFAGESCELILIPKIPFPNGKSKVLRARKERDESYLNYMAMQELVQASGRGMRSFDDRCEVIICDGSLSWFLAQNRSLAPRWFADSIRTVNRIPALPEKLK